MNIDGYRVIFLVVTLGIALVAASPIIKLVIPQKNSELFSELWLLGPDHLAEGYPFDIIAGNDYRVFVGVGNQLGETEYYKVYVKLCNITGYSPDVNGSVRLSCQPIYAYIFFIGNGKTWERSVTFRFENVVIVNDVLSVGNFVINDIAFPVDVSTLLNSANEGYFKLSFELWRYNAVTDDFRFDDRVVSLSLNLTSSN